MWINNNALKILNKPEEKSERAYFEDRGGEIDYRGVEKPQKKT